MSAAGAPDPGLERLPDRAREAAAQLERGAPVPDLAALLAELADDLVATRRQVERLGLDLHDEGMQLVAALAADLHLFRDQVGELLAGSTRRSRAVGRVDDLLARVAALDAVLREVAAATQLSYIARQPLEQSLRELADLYPDACTFAFDIAPELELAALSDSRRIALVRIVQSALANVVQHSDASLATVAVRSSPSSVEVEIVDDGRGFDVAAAVSRARTEGRLGLEGIRQRVVAQGGSLEIESRPGGPTRVFVQLPVDAKPS